MNHNIADIITTKQSAQAAITNGSGDGGDNVDGSNDLIIDNKNNNNDSTTTIDNDEPWYEDSQQVNTPPACPDTLQRLKRKMADNKKSSSDEAVEAKKVRSTKVKVLKKKKFAPNVTPSRPTTHRPPTPVQILAEHSLTMSTV